jgi:sec-independent protein translocase protein TatA
MPLGPWELVIILVIVVVIFGAGRLADIGGALGKSVREFRNATHDEAEPPAAPTAAASSTTTAPPAAASSTTTAATPAPAAENKCSSCGALNRADQTFCGQCGTRLTVPA